MATTISSRSPKLAMNPVLPFQKHNNIFLHTENTTNVSHPVTNTSQNRVLFPNNSVAAYGPLIPPLRTNAKADDSNVSCCGKIQHDKIEMDTSSGRSIQADPSGKPISNLTALLAKSDSGQQQEKGARPRGGQSTGRREAQCVSNQEQSPQNDTKRALVPSTDEVPPTRSPRKVNGSLRMNTPPTELPPASVVTNAAPGQKNETEHIIPHNSSFVRINSRRCLSSKDLVHTDMVPSSGSPYARMLYQKELIESSMAERLNRSRQNAVHYIRPPSSANTFTDDSSSSLRGGTRMTNEARNRRRAEHNRAIRNDLCDIVTDLFIAESKLLNPSKYGVDASGVERETVWRSVERFIKALPPRYALGAETPSEVLLHMRLMQAVRWDASRPTVHIAKLESDKHWNKICALSSGNTKGSEHNLMLVTIACSDEVGLLEYISKLLASGSSRVLDADVMLSSDNIVLDRFVVEMNGRLRLDKLASYIEKFLAKARKKRLHNAENEASCGLLSSCADESASGASDCSNSRAEFSGSLYYKPDKSELREIKNLEEEIRSALPLSALLAGQGSNSTHTNKMLDADTRFQPLFRNLSLPPNFRPAGYSNSEASTADRTGVTANKTTAPLVVSCDVPSHQEAAEKNTEFLSENAPPPGIVRERRPLVNREGNPDLDNIVQDLGNDDDDNGPSVEYLTLNGAGSEIESRRVPIIPFEQLMLIETLGMGRVSTIYRAAWSNTGYNPNFQSPETVMLALKVAMVNPKTLDNTHVNELRREADIAARLDHPHVCKLVGVAADPDCFCIAYEFCEGGSLLSLLSDSTRYYEYLPIALDIASGMAYLHSRNVIHRDLKPSNILLTGDNRAKIADFGMSVTHTGQELTAETGTYRYMAPEVIRHETYSSNADVYSFGICLWQLITREVPFATMSPIQAAYAVAEGRRPIIPESTPRRLRDIIMACWDQDSHKRPSFTYIAMALADYAKLAFSPANVGSRTLSIANEMLANVEGNSTVNVDFSAPVLMGTYLLSPEMASQGSSIGLEI